MNEQDALEVTKLAFVMACSCGDVELAEKKFPGQIASTVDEKGRNVFHAVSSKGHLSVLKLLISKLDSDHSLLHSTDKRGMTCLHLASMAGHLEIVQLLLAAPCNLR